MLFSQLYSSRLLRLIPYRPLYFRSHLRIHGDNGRLYLLVLVWNWGIGIVFVRWESGIEIGIARWRKGDYCSLWKRKG